MKTYSPAVDTLICLLSCFAIVLWMVTPDEKVRRSIRYLMLFVVIGAAAILNAGCAVTPDSMFPREPTTRKAETAWLGLHAIDTLQTAQAMRHPDCYHERNDLAAKLYGGDNPSPERVIATNIFLGFAHARVARWLDDKVIESTARDDANSNAWYIGRAVWYGISFIGTGRAVVGNAGGGVMPWGARCLR